MDNGLQQTVINELPDYPRADLVQSDFDSLINQKGRRVLIETALLCPCKSPNTQQQSTCKNCGGTGWVFINPRETRMVLQSMDAMQKYSGWSEELRGMMNVSCKANEELTYMDKITALDGESIHQEVLFLKQTGSIVFAYSAYPIKKILYIAKFISTTQKLVRLSAGSDYTIQSNVFTFNPSLMGDDVSITIRYKHAPAYAVVEMKRDTMQTFKLTEEGERNQNMPLAAYARRLHYMPDQQNIAGDRLLDNSYDVGSCGTSPSGSGCTVQVKTEGNLFNFYITQGDTFVYTLDILEDGLPADITGRTYKMQVRDAFSNLVTEFTVGNGGIIVSLPNTVALFKSSIQTAALTEGLYSYDLEETNGPDVETILSGTFAVAKQITV